VGPGLAVAVGLFAGFTLWRYALAHPITWPGLGTDASLVPEAAKLVRALSALGFLVVLNLAAWWIGGAVRRIVGQVESGPGADLDALARIAYGLIALPPIVLALAALHGLHAWLLAGLLGVPAPLALRDVAAKLGPGIGRWRARAAKRPGAAALIAAFALVVLQGPCWVALGPEVGWDADVYHLAIPARYLQLNGIEVTPFSMFSAFPAAMEMLYLLALALSGEAAAKLIHLELGLLTFALLYCVARRESARCALLAIVFLATEPLIYAEMGWAYADLFGAFYALFATVSWLDWRRSGRRELLVRAGVFAGACLSTRYLGGTVLLTLLALTWLAPRAGSAGRRLEASLWIGGLATLMLSPWLLRNALLTGNPVAPVLQGVFHAPGTEFFSEIAIAQTIAFDRAIGMGRDAVAYLMLPWNLTVGSTPGTYRNSFGFQIGALHVISLVAGAAVCVWRRRSDMALLLLQAWIFASAWFLVFQEVRFLLPLAATLSWVGAWAFDQLLPEARRWRAALLSIPAIALGYCWLAQLDGLGDRFALAIGGRSHETVLMRDSQRIALARSRAELGQRARIFLVGASRSHLFSGLDYVPYQALEGPPTLEWLRQARDVVDLHCRLDALGATHVLLDEVALEQRPKVVPSYGSGDFERDIGKVRRLMAQRGHTLHDRHGVKVVRLEPAVGCPDA
jgi:hypothetical protein